MIDHKHKIIFIHIPKCAGTSVYKFFNPDVKFDFRTPNYDIHYGWCPDRKIHMQHATSKQLVELDLISPEQWNTYFKFTFIRNPWDRVYSDYLWIRKTAKINDTFINYLNKSGSFSSILNDDTNFDYRGDHLRPQTDFFNDDQYKMDFIGNFETFSVDMEKILKLIKADEVFDFHENIKTKDKLHYSYFFSAKRKQLFEHLYQQDILKLDYIFQNKKKEDGKAWVPFTYYDIINTNKLLKK
ncbi:sulfotransferase family 2 domain-containing protein [uncultured Psychroserpens sp.]|uniref:sulfotransferase family 2 domain-containing protein n=1 Tax=uncultured Psychroserpens sp. TaxID=255436 RepID=UPI002601F56E|nr:sulfotransferase family 2 domain-containing protein [uncultured Psychroserpens sp.]